MSISIIGAGVGDTKQLTEAAKEKLLNADIIIGARRITEPFANSKQVFYEYDADKIAAIIRDTKFKNAAVLFSGDVSFYSGAKKLALRFPNAGIIAGISSVSYFCSKIGIAYDDMNIISLHGRVGNIICEVRRNYRTFALLGDNPCKKLCKYGMGTVKVWIGENLSYPDEKIHIGSASDFCDMKLSALSVIVIENPDYDSRMRIGIEDDEFTTGNVPMTKSSVRAVTMSKLEIKPDDVCYDIGAGTGSVSVEMALAAYKGRVYSVDKNRTAVMLTNENAKKFKCDNIRIIEGDAVDILFALPKADKVFIGGTSGTLKEVIKKCACSHIVINAVTLETLAAAQSVFTELGYNYEVVQISAACSKKIATYNMMTAQNPVFIITGKKGDT